MWRGYINGEKICESRFMFLARWKLMREVWRRPEVFVTVHLERVVRAP